MICTFYQVTFFSLQVKLKTKAYGYFNFLFASTNFLTPKSNSLLYKKNKLSYSLSLASFLLLSYRLLNMVSSIRNWEAMQFESSLTCHWNIRKKNPIYILLTMVIQLMQIMSQTNSTVIIYFLDLLICFFWCYCQT